MARARNLKPGFFTNEVLAECDPFARLLFQGLWCHADREGRLEDRPKKIKAEVLPYDDVNVDDLLSQLNKHGFIVRYQHGTNRYIQVINFVKHQNPHIKEQESTIPAPDLHQTCTVQAPDSNHTSTSGDSLSGQPSTELARPLIDSLLLIPSSLANAQCAQDENQLPAKVKLAGRVKSRSSIPDEFYPNENGLAFAIASGVDVDSEFPRFVNHHQAKGTIMADWQAAWRTWVGNAVKFGNAKPPVKQSAQQCRMNHLGFVEVHRNIGGISGWSPTAFKSIEDYQASLKEAA